MLAALYCVVRGGGLTGTDTLLEESSLHRVAGELERNPKVFACDLAPAALAFLFRPTLPPPRIIGSTQVTNDGGVKGEMVTDGFLRIYYFSFVGMNYTLYEVSAAGGDPVPVQTSIPKPHPEASKAAL
jgi:hypothetical protein